MDKEPGGYKADAMLGIGPHGKRNRQFEDNIIVYQSRKIFEMEDTIAHFKAKVLKLEAQIQKYKHDKAKPKLKDPTIASQMDLELNWWNQFVKRT